MKNKLLLLFSLIFLFTSCTFVSEYDMLKDAEQKYPHCIVYATGDPFKNYGEITVRDTVNNKIFIVNYYDFNRQNGIKPKIKTVTEYVIP